MCSSVQIDTTVYLGYPFSNSIADVQSAGSPNFSISVQSPSLSPKPSPSFLKLRFPVHFARLSHPVHLSLPFPIHCFTKQDQPSPTHPPSDFPARVAQPPSTSLASHSVKRKLACRAVSRSAGTGSPAGTGAGGRRGCWGWGARVKGEEREQQAQVKPSAVCASWRGRCCARPPGERKRCGVLSVRERRGAFCA
jgi:hypothetical protein